MSDPFWFLLAAKMLTSAFIVVAASLLVERSGPFLGAMIATLPISAGPAFAFLAAEHGDAFVAQGALAGLAVNAATVLLVLVYAALAQKHGLALSLGLAFTLWLVCAAAAARIAWTLPAAILVNALAFAPALAITARYRDAPASGPALRKWQDVPLRALGVMILVAIVVISGRLLGAVAAGVAAVVPIVLTSLAVILQPRIGGPAAAAVLSHALPGLIGFALAIGVLHLAAVPLGSSLALPLGLATCIGWNLGLFTLRGRGRTGKG